MAIAGGIARGLDSIHQQCTVHGNLKPSNIFLDDKMEPLLSEYGYARFMDPQKCYLLGYSAPERFLSESSDVYSFGVILLELLTGKTIEKTGMDLPKWVKSMVSEEWTGEVFDKEVSMSAKMWAFSLLKIGLMCVSDNPDNRPAISEVLEKMEEVMRGHSVAPSPYYDSTSLLHTAIPETSETQMEK